MNYHTHSIDSIYSDVIVPSCIISSHTLIFCKHLFVTKTQFITFLIQKTQRDYMYKYILQLSNWNIDERKIASSC